MKKLLSVVLILALLLPFAAFAEHPEVDQYYGYAQIEVTKSGAPYMNFLYFKPDYTCYYLTQLFYDNEPGLGRAYVGTWGYTAEGKVFAKVGDNVTLTLGFSSSGEALVDLEHDHVYFKISALMD